MNEDENVTPLGWYVRVTTNDLIRGEPVTMLYLAGYPNSSEAEEAVRRLRSISGEKYQAVVSAVAGRGPQPEPEQVMELKGAI